MARKQTRRCIGLTQSAFELVQKYAEARGISKSQVLETIIRASLPQEK